jgi:hypothetical protein
MLHGEVEGNSYCSDRTEKTLRGPQQKRDLFEGKVEIKK